MSSSGLSTMFAPLPCGPERPAWSELDLATFAYELFENSLDGTHAERQRRQWCRPRPVGRPVAELDLSYGTITHDETNENNLGGTELIVRYHSPHGVMAAWIDCENFDFENPDWGNVDAEHFVEFTLEELHVPDEKDRQRLFERLMQEAHSAVSNWTLQHRGIFVAPLRSARKSVRASLRYFRGDVRAPRTRRRAVRRAGNARAPDDPLPPSLPRLRAAAVSHHRLAARAASASASARSGAAERSSG